MRTRRFASDKRPRTDRKGDYWALKFGKKDGVNDAPTMSKGMVTVRDVLTYLEQSSFQNEGMLQILQRCYESIRYEKANPEQLQRINRLKKEIERKLARKFRYVKCFPLTVHSFFLSSFFECIGVFTIAHAEKGQNVVTDHYEIIVDGRDRVHAELRGNKVITASIDNR